MPEPPGSTPLRTAPSAAPRVSTVRILGIDPGSHTTGYGLIEVSRGKLAAVEFGAISCKPAEDLAERLVRIYDGLETVLERAQPDEVAIEGLFHAKNPRSALVLGHARGVVLLAAARRGIPIREYAPRAVKQAVVGTGSADKHQVQAMVKILLRLKAPIKPLDASDGLAIAICHAHSRRVHEAARRAGVAAR